MGWPFCFVQRTSALGLSLLRRRRLSAASLDFVGQAAHTIRRADVAEADVALALEHQLVFADSDIVAAVRRHESAVGAFVGEDAFAVAQFDGAVIA